MVYYPVGHNPETLGLNKNSDSGSVFRKSLQCSGNFDNAFLGSANLKYTTDEIPAIMSLCIIFTGCRVLGFTSIAGAYVGDTWVFER